MKVISIGRGEDCNIVLPENVISRRHAILKIHATGKMELIDMGQNGTFVNGIKLTPNIPYPVTRKDVVSFAHVRQLDWSLVPNTMRIYRYIALGAVLAVAIVVPFALTMIVGKKKLTIPTKQEEKDFIHALLNFVHNGTPMPLEFLETQKSNIAIYYALNFTQSILLQNQSLLISSASSLKSLLPNDPLSNLLELLALNYKDDPKSLSLKLQSYYQNSSINKEPIYYGAAVVREIYIEIAYIIGSLHYVQKDLDNRLITEQKDVRGVIQALALTYIYLQEFEKSFTLYNSLIDDFKEQDTQTLFLAAVAAVGAGHTENAATLLQLSKLEAPTNYETRIANGILYLQENNYNAAASQFTTIGNSGIISEFFDFKIDTEKLLNR